MVPMIDTMETGINIRRLMDSRGLTVKDVKRYLGLGCVQSVYRWIDGNNVPSVDNLYALSQLFQVPIDAIVCGNRPPLTQRDISDNDVSLRIRMSAYYDIFLTHNVS